jgi:hypothetical protein
MGAFDKGSGTGLVKEQVLETDPCTIHESPCIKSLLHVPGCLPMEPSKPNPTEQDLATKGRRHSSPAVLARSMLLIRQH